MIEHPTKPTVETLLEQQHLYDLLTQRWCLGVDTVNWQLVRSIYSDDEVEVNFYSDALPDVPPPKVWKTDDWLKFCRQIEGFDVTQHCLSNFIYDIGADSSTVKTYLVSEHQLDGDSYVVGGQYTHQFKRTPSGWKLSKVALAPWWTRGNQELFLRAADRYAKGNAPRSAKALL